MRLTPRVLGLAVSQARKERGLTQAELAQQINVSRKWLSGLENGRSEVNLRSVLEVLAVLGYSLNIEREVELPSPQTQLSTDTVSGGLS